MTGAIDCRLTAGRSGDFGGPVGDVLAAAVMIETLALALCHLGQLYYSYMIHLVCQELANADLPSA
jgi:hypothetical protein